MLAFIQSQPSVIDKLLYHIETPAFADLLMRIVQLDEQPVGVGVLQVCCIPRITWVLGLNPHIVAFQGRPDAQVN